MLAAVYEVNHKRFNSRNSPLKMGECMSGSWSGLERSVMVSVSTHSNSWVIVISHLRLCHVTRAASPSPGPDTFTTIRLSEDEAAAGVFTSPGLTLPRPTLARQYNAGKYGLLPLPSPS